MLSYISLWDFKKVMVKKNHKFPFNIAFHLTHYKQIAEYTP